MESHHEFTVGQELQPATETGQIPAVPASADAGEQETTWRSSLAVSVSLLAAFAVVTLVAL